MFGKSLHPDFVTRSLVARWLHLVIIVHSSSVASMACRLQRFVFIMESMPQHTFRFNIFHVSFRKVSTVWLIVCVTIRLRVGSDFILHRFGNLSSSGMLSKTNSTTARPFDGGCTITPFDEFRSGTRPDLRESLGWLVLGAKLKAEFEEENESNEFIRSLLRGILWSSTDKE